MTQPCVLEETEDYAVVYKPARMHCAPLVNKTEGTLQEWFAAQCSVQGVELMHRLDFETRGLVLFSKNTKSFDFFKDLQDKGEFIKEYSAICNEPAPESPPPEGYPPPPPITCYLLTPTFSLPANLESYFRPFGPGRKLVRPVVEIGKKHKEIAKDKGGFYRTEITGINGNVFTVRLRRGFRHQIRCHLCWAGRPILNDPLYPYPLEEAPAEGLALCAHGLFFADPSSGKPIKCGIEPLTLIESSNFSIF